MSVLKLIDLPRDWGQLGLQSSQAPGITSPVESIWPENIYDLARAQIPTKCCLIFSTKMITQTAVAHQEAPFSLLAFVQVS